MLTSLAVQAPHSDLGNEEYLPQSSLTYLAFRLAAIETVRLMEFYRPLGPALQPTYGYLTEVPFLREVAPVVQLCLLADTWTKHISAEKYRASILEESVVYAACEAAARITEGSPSLVRSYLSEGPLNVSFIADKFLVSELRSLHLKLSDEGNFLLISQFLDLVPEDAVEWKKQFHLDDLYLQPMFDILGRWYPSPALGERMTGLLSHSEIRSLMGLSSKTIRT